MFDDSTFIDDSTNINHHDNSIPKIVSKRSVSDNSNIEPSWWERIKRSVSNFFAPEEEHPTAEQSHSETLPVITHDSINESLVQRKSRQADDTDDEEDDDDDNEISGDGLGGNEIPDKEITTDEIEKDPVSPMPDIPDNKYCELKKLINSIKFKKNPV